MLKVLAAVLVGAASAHGAAATRPAAKVWLKEDDAPADYRYQGEYEGTVGRQKWGAQVVALGDGRFKAVLLAGGLPGAGHDGKTRREIPGQLAGAKAVFDAEGWTLNIADGKLAGKTDAGEEIAMNRVVRTSPTLGAKPPPGAIVLFDGTNLNEWKPGAKMDDRGLLAVGAFTKQDFTDFTLHLEFILPFMPASGSQGRANSGVYIQNRYEIQILDSFGLVPSSGDCGAIYRQVAPAVNMCLPPLQWQTYDIDFTAPRWQDGRKIANARVTVRHNGVVIHDNREIATKTGAGKPEAPEPGPIQLQNHGNPVFFRNVWIVPK